MSDLVQSVRSLLRNPAYTTVALLTLTIGIAANTVVYSFNDALLERPFAFPQLEQIITLQEMRPPKSGNAAGTGTQENFTTADYLALQQETLELGTLAAYRTREFAVLGGQDGPEWEQGVEATPSLFQTVGVMPELGRGFTEEETQPGKDHVAVVTHLFRKLRMNDDPNPVGKRILLDSGATYTVVGVMPERYEYTYPVGGVRVITPLRFTPEEAVDRQKHDVRVVGRLKEGGSLAALRSQLSGIAARWAQQFPATNAGWKLEAIPLKEAQRNVLLPFALLFGISAAFVLLIGCANLASLLLARAVERQRRVAVQAAIGATKWQIARQILIESLLVSAVSGAAALAVAYRGVEAIRLSVPVDIAKHINGWREIRMDGRGFAFGLIMAVVATVVFGLIPAVQSSRTNLTSALKDGGTTSSGGVLRRRLRYGMVVAQVTLAFILIVGSGLMFRGMNTVAEMYRDYEPDKVLTARVDLPEDTYPSRQSMVQFYDRLQERLISGTLGDVRSVAITSNMMGTLRGLTAAGIRVDGRPAVNAADLPTANLQTVSPGYFETSMIHLVKGRAFGAEDGPDAPRVAIISEAMVKRMFPGQDPIGQRLQVESAAFEMGDTPGEKPWVTVVGVAGDIKQYWIDREPRNTVYFPTTQAPRRQSTMMIRTSGDPYALVRALRAMVLTVDPNRPIYGARSLKVAQNDNLAPLVVFASMMAIFGLVALLLSAIGIYGVISYQVTQRTREVAIRLSLGAEPAQVVRMILWETSKLLGLGLGLGLLGAYALIRVASSALYGIVGLPASNLVALVAGVALIGLLAGLIPARRAAALEPALALRHD